MGLNKGQINSGSFKKGDIPWIQGRKHSENTKKKLSEAASNRIYSNKGKKYNISEETRKRMSDINKNRIQPWKGTHLSEDRKRLLSDYWNNKYKNGYVHPMKGKKKSKEKIENIKLGIKINGGRKSKGKTYEELYGKDKSNEIKKKIGKASKENGIPINTAIALSIFHKNIKGRTYREIYGEDKSNKIKDRLKKSFSIDRKNTLSINASKRINELHPNWLGGKSFEPYDIKFNNMFKRNIRKRDNQVCMLCGMHREKLNRALSIHHINYDKLLSIPENCVSLCINCHVKTNYNREHWIKFFQSLLQERYGYNYSENLEPIITI